MELDDNGNKLKHLAESDGLKLASRLSGAFMFPLVLWALNSLNAMQQDMASVKTALQIQVPTLEHRLDSLEEWRNKFDVIGPARAAH